MQQKVFVLGYPWTCGGASTELGHTVRLWRKYGVDVRLLPTWGAPPPAMIAMMDECGATTHVVSPDASIKNEDDRRAKLHRDIEQIPDLEGSVVSSFCNSALFTVYPVFKKLGCKVVYSNCMTWCPDTEFDCIRENGLFDAYHFQSNYQREMIEPRLKEFGYQPEQGHLIRGAFDTQDWPYKPLPHARQSPFVLGKLARCDMDKWSSDFFRIFKMIQYRQKKLLMMAYSTLAHRKLGTMPPNAEWLKEGAMTAQEFIGSIHCMIGLNGGAAENWPRVGLEAMASGAVNVCENRWGWTEMIDHGETGFLADDDEAMAHFAALLAHDERLRLKIAGNAREALESKLARPEDVWRGWSDVFRKLGA